MASLEELERKRDQINERIKIEKRKRAQEERKAENHAKLVIGGMVLSHFDGDWKTVDFEKLATYFEKYAWAIAKNDCEPLDLTDAKKRLRNWEFGHNHWDSWDKIEKEPELLV